MNIDFTDLGTDSPKAKKSMFVCAIRVLKKVSGVNYLAVTQLNQCQFNVIKLRGMGHPRMFTRSGRIRVFVAGFVDGKCTALT